MRGREFFFAALTGVIVMSAVPAGTTTAPAAQEGEARVRAVMARANAQLEAMGMDVRVAIVDYYTASHRVGQTVFFDDRTKQLGAHWVPGDTRRNAQGTAITYLVDQSDGATDDGLVNADTEPAIDRGMQTWQSADCSHIPLVKVADSGMDPDIVDFFLGFGGFGNPFLADVVHAGWMPRGFFDALVPPDGGDFILGVTVTFAFADPDSGNDIDNNGKLDTALAEIYYNDAFSWAIDANIDVESVALHESGHALSQGHFGALFRTESNGKFHFSPRSVMNAGYTGVQQQLTGTDSGGHCSIWGSWPNR